MASGNVTTTQPTSAASCGPTSATAAVTAFACNISELGDDDLLVSRELEEIAAASRRQHEPHYASTSFFDHRGGGGATAAITAGELTLIF
jgi:hypothetical protein